MKKTTARVASKAAAPSIWKLSATAAGVSVLCAMTTSAYAQTVAPPAQTITVTGIRKGIEDAISVKKNSDSIVEAVSAEDIGKLPDASVAESLSRLPGVTVQRSTTTGRAQGVSVRGMSPDFNGGLLNGREQASTSGSRGVEFDQYPSELLGQLVVYKTPNASLLGQGLASTIDQITIRPLDFGKRTVAVGYRREHNTAADSGPGFGTGSGDRFNVSYVDQFADRTVGVALGFARYDLKGGGRPRTGWGGSVDFDLTTNTFAGWDGAGCRVAGAQCVKAPQGIQFDTESINTKRDGLMATLQWKPSKSFESVLDIFYSKGDTSVKKRGLEGPVGALTAGANDTGGTLQPGYTLTADGRAIASGTLTNFRGVIRSHNEDFTDELKSVGWNNKFKFAEWTFGTDLSVSKVVKDATRLETTSGLPGNVNDPRDTISWTGFNGNNTDVTRFTTGLNYADPSVIRLTNPQGWGGTAGQDGYYSNPVTTDTVNGVRLNAKRELQFGPIVDVDVGVHLGDRKKTRNTREGALLLPGSVNTAAQASAAVPNPGSSIAGTSGIPILTWEPAGSVGSVYALSAWSDADILAKSWGVKEKVTTAYVKGNLDGKLGGLDVRGNVGLQLVSTKQTSTGSNIDSARCVGDTHTCPSIPYSVGTSYNEVLPSLNLATDVGNDSVVRLGLGRQLARASMEDLRATTDFSFDSTSGVIKGNGGNPYLKPFKADALDISYEKYFGTKGYFSAAAFYKDLKTYILKTEERIDFTPFLLPSSNVPPGQVQGLYTAPRNGTGGRIAGVEFAVNVPFSLFTQAMDGFGAQFSYSHTNSSVKLPTSGVNNADIGGPNVPLPGLSRDVINLRFYYEAGGFQVGIAARHRSKFVGSISDYQDKNQLVWFKPETTVDLQAAYEIQTGSLKGLSFLGQANNVTNTEQVRFNEVSGDVKERKKFGSQYLLGVNYKF
jgi:iron complex outermembrane recepter protein